MDPTLPPLPCYGPLTSQRDAAQLLSTLLGLRTPASAGVSVEKQVQSRSTSGLISLEMQAAFSGSFEEQTAEQQSGLMLEDWPLATCLSHGLTAAGKAARATILGPTTQVKLRSVCGPHVADSPATFRSSNALRSLDRPRR